MDKSPEAFRTISEVAESLETPAHVLRFWESRFPQIKPVKRAGGRRYYRPADVALLSGIRHLLHHEGLTIRGVQKILREQGVRHVAALAGGGEGVEYDADLAEDLAGSFEFAAEVGADVDVTALAEAPAGAVIHEFDPSFRPRAVVDDVSGEVVNLRGMAPPAAPEAPDDTLTPPVIEDAPEAGHVWVEDEPQLELSTPTPLFLTQGKAEDAPAMDQGQPPMVPGIAARLRALPRPVSPQGLADLTELHNRLGLLQAQIVEALRQRR